MGKARVVPIRVVSIPCLELTAATISAAVSNTLQEELELEIDHGPVIMKSVEHLTPNHLLTMKSIVALPPPGSFVREDLPGKDGGECNTCRSNSGVGGAKNTWPP